MFLRENTRKISIGNLTIGGSDKITVQSMTNTDTRDSAATIRQIKELEEAGCDIVRVAVPDMEAAGRIKDIVALHDYIVSVTFQNGIVKEFDLKKYFTLFPFQHFTI